MVWSYINPRNDEKDQVRLKIGDTRFEDPLMEDEDIIFLLEKNNLNVTRAAAEAARSIAAKFSTMASESIGKWKGEFSKRAEVYMALAKRIEFSSEYGLAGPHVTGISKSEKIQQSPDMSGMFKKGMHEVG